ncbi:MAG: hypothetical protein HUN05_19125 [Desulfobacter sp.]|nr:MAG: hypothetical protein HUN05_19125 [Desulfobacter sp.]
MKIPIIFVIKICILALVLAGCSVAVYDYQSAPVSQNLETELFQARFTPEKNQTRYFTYFKLDLKNLSQDPIEIDWNKTAYLLNGKHRGLLCGKA